MESTQEYHERRAREQRKMAAAASDKRHRQLHEELARLHDKRAKPDRSTLHVAFDR